MRDHLRDHPRVVGTPQGNLLQARTLNNGARWRLAMASTTFRSAAVAIGLFLAGASFCPILAFGGPLAMADPGRQTTTIFDQVVRDPASAPAQDDAVLPPELRRQIVTYTSQEAPGTIVIDTPHTYLYYVLGGGKAIRYGIGVGREGFTWSGVQKVSRKAEWPDWVPPVEMIKRQQYLPRWVAGGPGNPLGARAMYLGDTAYRIHGTNDPTTIGQKVSSGCVRLTNEDVTDLFGRTNIGTKVVVLPDAARRAGVAQAAPADARAQATTLPPTNVSDRKPVEPLASAFGLY
jgi:lipoprotein-anchoring transpeptidase ErfK/SrfK